VARHVELADDAVLASSVAADLAKIAHRMHRDVLAPDDRRRSRRRRGPAWTADRVAVRVHELIWSHSALGAAASALRIADQPAAADAIDGLVPSVRAALDEVLSGALDAEAATAAVVAFVDSDSPLVRAGAVGFDALVDQVTADGLESAIWLAVGRAGLSPGLAGSIGTALARRGDPAAVLALRWLLEVGEPTWAWPTAVHPRTGGGSAGDGHSPASTAAFLRLVRSLAALDDDKGIDLLPVVPTEWLGQPIEVHDLPTRHGRLSFAIRWHGERPALLWDLVGQADPAIAAGRGPSASVTLRCSGLDPVWSSTEQRGEALLSAPPAPPSVELGGDEAEPDEVTTMRATEPVEPPAQGGSFS
jgi:hypothetical protein